MLLRAVNNHWTGLVEWTTGLTIFALQIIFMPTEIFSDLLPAYIVKHG